MGKRARIIDEWLTKWTDKNDVQWEVDTRWADIDGRAECVELTLRSFKRPLRGRSVEPGDWVQPAHPDQDVRPVRAEVLRAFTMGVIERRLRESIASEHSDRGLFPDEAKRAKYLADGRGRRLVGADGEPLPAHEALAAVADVYSAAWRDGVNSPNKAVAEAFGLSTSAAAKRVARARQAGLLPRTQQGRMRGVGQ